MYTNNFFSSFSLTRICCCCSSSYSSNALNYYLYRGDRKSDFFAALSGSYNSEIISCMPRMISFSLSFLSVVLALPFSSASQRKSNSENLLLFSLSVFIFFIVVVVFVLLFYIYGLCGVVLVFCLYTNKQNTNRNGGVCPQHTTLSCICNWLHVHNSIVHIKIAKMTTSLKQEYVTHFPCANYN